MLIGVLIESDGNSGPPTLEADEIGNVKDGRTLFVTQGCSMCHGFEGQGGTDVPSLDFMKGELTGGDIANMSGLITGNQMASLIAYLHAGGPPPDMKMSDEMMGGEKQQRKEPRDEGSSGGRMMP